MCAARTAKQQHLSKRHNEKKEYHIEMEVSVQWKLIE